MAFDWYIYNWSWFIIKVKVNVMHISTANRKSAFVFRLVYLHLTLTNYAGEKPRSFAIRFRKMRKLSHGCITLYVSVYAAIFRRNATHCNSSYAIVVCVCVCVCLSVCVCVCRVCGPQKNVLRYRRRFCLNCVE